MNNFIGSKEIDKMEQDGVYLLGIPYDASTSYKGGAKFGPTGARLASQNLEEYSPYLKEEMKSFYDLGDLEACGRMFEKFSIEFREKTSLSKKRRLLTVGGEHSISYFPLKEHLGFYDDLTIIHLDAHADLRDAYLEDPHSHASVMKRTWELMNHKKQKLIQYGIRSGTKSEFEFMKKNQTIVESRSDFIDKIEKIDKASPIYLTFDFDFLDPSEFPGTGTPEAGGESFHTIVKLFKILKKKNLVGADVVELSPGLDVSGISSALASKVVRELIILLQLGFR